MSPLWVRTWRKVIPLLLALLLLLPHTAVLAHGDHHDDLPVTVDPLISGKVTFRAPSLDALKLAMDLGIAMESQYQEVANGVYLIELIVNPDELVALEALGFIPLSHAEQDSLAEWAERLREREQITEEQEMVLASTDTVRVLRADYFENFSGAFLSIEARTSAGTSASVTLRAYSEEMGTLYGTMSRFVDAGAYMYHRLLVPVTSRPDSILVTSTQGGSATREVRDFPGWDPGFIYEPEYRTSFVDKYMDPTEVYAMLESLAAQYPDISEIIELPYKTNGYRRKAQLVTGSVTNRAVVWTSKAWGHEGGNDLQLRIVNPGAPSQPLGITVDGNLITVSPATNAAGSITTTAAQLAAAVNAREDLPVIAYTYQGNAGTGAVEVSSARQLTDNLNAPAHISREPFTVKAIRIGKHRDGSKTGVFLYAQEHAREWVTPLVALETAARLLHNYGSKGHTKQLVDNLDIFIIPTVNPDGSHYSFYDYNMQRKNMTNYGAANISDPARRNQWGVDLNRNFTVGTMWDGYSGASNNPLSETYAGIGPLTEPEVKNEVWLVETFPNIKFSMNIHSHGGYFMWAPGAYRSSGRVTLPRPTTGQEQYFWYAAERILGAIHGWRGTVIQPGRTGPTADVLYSAAGNSADEMWYNHGVYAWNFEVGAQIWNPNNRSWVSQGFQPPWREAFQEAMEFASGSMELLRVALDYERDRTRPRSWAEVTAEPGSSMALEAIGAPSVMTVEPQDDQEAVIVVGGPVRLTLLTSEAADIYYTLDGSRPTFSSPLYGSAGVRDGGEELLITESTTISFFAVDARGNVEKNYNPAGRGQNYNRIRIVIQTPALVSEP